MDQNEIVNVNTLPAVENIPDGKKIMFVDSKDNTGGVILFEKMRKQIAENAIDPVAREKIANLDLKDQISSDRTLTIDGGFADAKTVGDKIKDMSEQLANAGQAEVPDNVVLYEEVSDESPSSDIETIIEEKIKENLTLDADGEFLYLLYAETELAKVPMGSNGGGETVACTGVVINESSLTIDINNSKTYTLSATVSPVDCTQTLKWFSSVTSVATISSSGVLKVVGEGSTIITARCGSYTDTISITVVDLNVSANIDKGSGWFISGGKAQLDDNYLRAHTYYGDQPPAQFTMDTNYEYGIPLKKGISYVIYLDTTISEGFYGPQIYDASTTTRVVDAGWKTAGTKYSYTPEKDSLYLYVNFKYTAGGTTITDDVLAQLKAAFSISVG